MSTTTDILILGGGVMGLSLALEAKRRHPDQQVILLEKEATCGSHASGRNSGVLHAGFYYTADSLKARFTREGNRWWTEYCKEHGLRLNPCGKLVVATEPEDVAGLEELLRRGRVNGVELQELTLAEAKRIEPRVKSVGKVLYSPTTATVDPKEIIRHLHGEAQRAGVTIRLGEACRGRASDGALLTDRDRITAGYVINAAGLYADKLARMFGFSQDLVILPFKGLYLYSTEPIGSLRTHIYPVPNLANPFLGVHYTLTVDGSVKIGPTAIPAFWREHYQGWSGFRWDECLDILWRDLGLWLRNDFSFRQLAMAELAKQRRGQMVKLASKLLESVDAGAYRTWGAPGIRAQLLRVSTRRLEMDFCFEGDHQSFHVLNAVSPGFTCAMPFSRFLFDRIDERMGGTPS